MTNEQLTPKGGRSQSTYVPPEWNGRNFNVWQRHIQRGLDKAHGTELSKRYFVK